MAFLFRLPSAPYEQKLSVCLSIMQEQNNELVPFRRKIRSYELQIEKLTITNNRYSAALFNHRNFKHPGNSRNRQKGGKVGFTYANRETYEDYRVYQYKRLFLAACCKSGKSLPRDFSVRKKFY